MSIARIRYPKKALFFKRSTCVTSRELYCVWKNDYGICKISLCPLFFLHFFFTFSSSSLFFDITNIFICQLKFCRTLLGILLLKERVVTRRSRNCPFAIEIFWGNIYLRIIYDGNDAGRRETKTKRNARFFSEEGAAMSRDNPFIRLSDECRKHGHSLSSRRPRRRPSGLIVSFRKRPHPHLRATPTSESIYLRTFKASPLLLALKDSVNWLEIDSNRSRFGKWSNLF